MFGRIKMTAKCVNPIGGLPQIPFLFIVLVMVFLRHGFLHVGFVLGVRTIENRRVIAAMKISVSLGKKMIGKQTAAVTDQHAERIGVAGSHGTLRPRFQVTGQRETERKKKGADELWNI